MSFNRRGGERRPDRPERFDRDRGERPSYPPRGGDRPPYQQRGEGGGDRPPYQRGGGGDRPPYQQRGGDRPPYQSRPRFNPEDEGAMQLRLDPRRLSALKRLAGEAGTRPGELARQWVEERIDAARTGGDRSLAEQLADLAARVEALEGGRPAPVSQPAPRSQREPEPEPQAQSAALAPEEPMQESQEPEVPEAEPVAGPPRRRARGNTVAAAPTERVALHDEMIAVLRERGPMSAGDLAATIAERGRYAPPRSGKPLDAAMVSQRVSNPTYRSRFTRQDGKIGLAQTE